MHGLVLLFIQLRFQLVYLFWAIFTLEYKTKSTKENEKVNCLLSSMEGKIKIEPLM